ncbi:unnamed protein product [Adineta steineri]|uniref:G-protein coupled receptors family 1 profile domain-containing protein n=1 Tax=Adineta steineri TaxID=433720 RepID=A0A815M232_9BILA|nr:unnamed protein product [Adineta steineri]CAF1619994.1 unnamed protein product [Adineta steineri]
MASSSTNENSYDYYTIIQNELYITICPILIGIGIIGSTYLIAFNISNFLSLIFGLLPPVLSYSINFDLSSSSVIYCKFRFYLSTIFSTLSPIYLVLASIDRVLITSTNALLRQRSTCSLAYWSIGITAIIGLLFYIQIFVRVNIQKIFTGVYFCYYDSDIIYGIVFVYSRLLINGLIPTFSMSVSAILTLKNINQLRINPTIRINNQLSKDRQLTVMLVSEIVIYVLFNFMTPVTLIYFQSTQYQMQTIQQQALNSFLIGVSFFLSYIPVSINLIVSKSFRQNIIKMFSKICGLCSVQYNRGRMIKPAATVHPSFIH